MLPKEIIPFLHPKATTQWVKYHNVNIRKLLPKCVFRSTRYPVKDGVTYDVYGYVNGTIVDIVQTTRKHPKFDMLPLPYKKHVEKIYEAFGIGVAIICYNPNIELYTSVIYYPDPCVKECKVRPYMSSQWVRASGTRNYALEDPILDYFEMQDKMKKSKKRARQEDVPRETSGMTALFQMGNEFEAQCVSNLIERFPTCFYTVCEPTQSHLPVNFQTTCNAIRMKFPIIYQAVLHDRRRKLNGCADFLIRTDFLQTVAENTRPPSDSPPEMYCVVDAKFHKLALMANGANILNDPSVRAFKTQVCVYNKILSGIQGWDTGCAYILGRGYQLGKERNVNPFDRLGLVDFTGVDKPIVSLTDEAIRWKRKCNLGIAKQPAPNMKNRSDDKYHDRKVKIAEATGEITQLCYIGPRARELATDVGVMSLTDPRLNAKLLGFSEDSSVSIEIDALIAGLTQKQPITMRKGTKLPVQQTMAFVDFESFFNFNTDSTVPYFFGVGVVNSEGWTYQYVLLKDLESCKEFGQEVHDVLHEIMKENKLKVLNCYSWTGVEERMLRDVLMGVKSKISIKFNDMHAFCKHNSVIIKGMLNHSLKTVGAAMHKNGLTPFHWSDTDNQMFEVTAHYVNGKPLRLAELVDYNEMDCLMVAEFVRVVHAAC